MISIEFLREKMQFCKSLKFKAKSIFLSTFLVLGLSNQKSSFVQLCVTMLLYIGNKVYNIFIIVYNSFIIFIDKRT